jgi:hypothetical protein
MLKLLWKLCLLKANVEEIPHSIPLLLGIICINFSTLFFVISLASASLLVGAWKAFALEALIAIFSYLVLYSRSFEERFVQVLSSLLGTTTFIMAMVAFPYIFIFYFLILSPIPSLHYIGLILSTILLFVGSAWLFVIFTRIYERALEISLNASLFITLILFAFMSLIISLLSFL